ncbi:MAG: hypothetical protein HYR85_04745 [Planctomycetes bacterium]|nr:hypothetical protein [Planctomycetota bacterium]MBI3844155.1 hypothetical protein [Planctomycetota bacterium]
MTSSFPTSTPVSSWPEPLIQLNPSFEPVLPPDVLGIYVYLPTTGT